MVPNSFWSSRRRLREKNAGRGKEFLTFTVVPQPANMHTYVPFNEGCLPHLGRKRFNWAHQGARPPACTYMKREKCARAHVYIEFYKSLLASCKVLLLLVCLRQVCDKWKTRSTTLQRGDADCAALHIPGTALMWRAGRISGACIYSVRPTQTYTLEFRETF